MAREFWAVFDNPIKGAPFSHFELEAMERRTEGDKTVVEPVRNDEPVKGEVIYSLFGRHDLERGKKHGRECIGGFSDLSAALETMQDMGIITHAQRLRYDTKAQTRELFPDE